MVEGLREPRETLASWPVPKQGGGEGKDGGGLNGRWARARAGWASASLALWFEWVLSMDGTGRPEPRPGIKRWGGGKLQGFGGWGFLMFCLDRLVGFGFGFGLLVEEVSHAG